MKTIIKRDASAKVGYVLIDIDDQGVETSKTLEWSKLPGNIEFRLPENFANRQYFKLSGLKGRDEVELPYHETRVLGPKGSKASTPKAPKFDDFMALAESDEERAMLEAMRKRAQAKAEREKLEKELKAAEALVAELKAKRDALK